MLIYDRNPDMPSPVRPPALSLLSWGVGVVRFAWTFRRQSPFWYAYYNYTPGAVIEFQGREIPLVPEDIVLIPPHTPFSTRNAGAFEHLWFHFVTGGATPVFRPEPIRLAAEDYLPFLRRIRKGGERNEGFLLYGLLLEMLASKEVLSAESGRVANWDERMPQAIALLSKGCTVAEAGKRLGMSVGNFQRLFRHDMGISPKSFSMQLRMENARRALEDGRQSIEGIAADNGFGDRYSFSKAFRKYTGIPPVAYRRQLHGKAGEARI